MGRCRLRLPAIPRWKGYRPEVEKAGPPVTAGEEWFSTVRTHRASPLTVTDAYSPGRITAGFHSPARQAGRADGTSFVIDGYHSTPSSDTRKWQTEHIRRRQQRLLWRRCGHTPAGKPLFEIFQRNAVQAEKGSRLLSPPGM